MKLTENQLRKTRRLYKTGKADISFNMERKLKKKGVISGHFGYFFTTKKGDEELRKRFGEDF